MSEAITKAIILIVLILIASATTSCSGEVEDTSSKSALVHMRLIDGDPKLCPATFTTTEQLAAVNPNDSDCVIYEEIYGSFVHMLCAIPDIPECMGEIIIRKTEDNELTTRVAVSCGGESMVCYYRANVYFDKTLHKVCDDGYQYKDGRLSILSVCN